MKKTKTLKELRAEIDEVDSRLLELLNRRAGLVIEVGHTKSQGGKKFYVPERERQIYERLKSRNKGPFPDDAVRNVFREIISASLALEQPLKVAFLGPVATFTHEACMQHFGLSGMFVPKNDISDVFNDVEAGRADFGVVPIENTAEGVVSHTLDMFVSSELKICAEILLEVSLALLNSSGELSDAETVCSHPHAIAQCRNWLKGHLPDATLQEVSSTAMAAKLASDDPRKAAIASVAAANLYDLNVIEKNIQDNPSNFTRFLVIGREEMKKTGKDKTSLMFAIKDAPGALYNILKPFAGRNLNLTKIESRPLKTKAWEYVFFVDLDGHITDPVVAEAVEELRPGCSFLKILGSYPKAH